MVVCVCLVIVPKFIISPLRLDNLLEDDPSAFPYACVPRLKQSCAQKEDTIRSCRIKVNDSIICFLARVSPQMVQQSEVTQCCSGHM